MVHQWDKSGRGHELNYYNDVFQPTVSAFQLLSCVKSARRYDRPRLLTPRLTPAAVRSGGCLGFRHPGGHLAGGQVFHNKIRYSDCTDDLRIRHLEDICLELQRRNSEIEMCKE